MSGGDSSYQEYQPVTDINFTRKNAAGKEEIIGSVRLGPISEWNIKGGNKNLGEIIQIETADGKIHKIEKPKFPDNVRENYDFVSRQLSASGKDGAYAAITPEIIDRAKQVTTSSLDQSQQSAKPTPEQQNALNSAKAAIDATRGAGHAK